MQNNIQGIDENLCCGCGACRQICPQFCISSSENKRGFILPVVDAQKCVNCGQCKKVCPWLSMPKKNHVITCYIAKAVGEGIQKKSTSGGVFRLLAEAVLNHGGVVYGCEWTEELLVHHIRVTYKDDLEKLQQSKYVQSDTDRTFIEAKKDLKANRMVLYSGTACQLAGLKNFVGEHEKLILVEVACHGVPSPGLFREYIQWIEEKTNKHVVGYQFRNRKKHKKGEHYQLKIAYSDGTEEYRYAAFDPYYAAFISGRTLRGTCYDCKYKGEERIGDILLADFWGCEKVHPGFDCTYGSSAIAIMTPKGEALFNEIIDGIEYSGSTWTKVVSHNKSLINSAECNERYQGIDVEKLIPSITMKRIVKVYTPEFLKNLIKRL